MNFLVRWQRICLQFVYLFCFYTFRLLIAISSNTILKNDCAYHSWVSVLPEIFGLHQACVICKRFYSLKLNTIWILQLGLDWKLQLHSTPISIIIISTILTIGITLSLLNKYLLFLLFISFYLEIENVMATPGFSKCCFIASWKLTIFFFF